MGTVVSIMHNTPTLEICKSTRRLLSRNGLASLAAANQKFPKANFSLTKEAYQETGLREKWLIRPTYCSYQWKQLERRTTP